MCVVPMAPAMFVRIGKLESPEILTTSTTIGGRAMRPPSGVDCASLTLKRFESQSLILRPIMVRPVNNFHLGAGSRRLARRQYPEQEG